MDHVLDVSVWPDVLVVKQWFGCYSERFWAEVVFVYTLWLFDIAMENGP